MHSDLKIFSIKLLIVSVVTGIVSFLVFNNLPDKYDTNSWVWLLIFFFVSNLALYHLYIRAKEKKLSKFANFFMLATFLKLIVYLAVIIVYLLYNRSEAISFLLTFFVYYVIFTALEVLSVSKAA